MASTTGRGRAEELLARVPLPGSVRTGQWRTAFANPHRDRRVAVAMLILAALASTHGAVLR